MRKPKYLYYCQHAGYRKRENVFSSQVSLPHTLVYSPKALYNIRRLLRNYYNYSVINFPFSKTTNKSVEKNPKHQR